MYKTFTKGRIVPIEIKLIVWQIFDVNDDNISTFFAKNISLWIAVIT